MPEKLKAEIVKIACLWWVRLQLGKRNIGGPFIFIICTYSAMFFLNVWLYYNKMFSNEKMLGCQYNK
jgi:hypothetical protein